MHDGGSGSHAMTNKGTGLGGGLRLNGEEVDCHVMYEEEYCRVDGLTGTSLQYHLLGDLMVDDHWTPTGESGRCIRPTAGGKICHYYN